MRQRRALPSALAYALALAISFTQAAAAATSSYPTKPLRLVVTFPAGGTADLLGRVVGQELSTILGQPVVVDNPGGSGRCGRFRHRRESAE